MPDKELGNPIARGRTADVYAWKEGWILKLFHPWFPDESVQYEARLARAAYAAGLPAPAVGDIVEVDSRLGLVYERVEGRSMLDAFLARPWTLVGSARLLADLHAEMHSRDIAAELPSQRERLERKIRQAEGLRAQLRKAALVALAEMPDRERLCHGDFHPGNVILSGRGPVIIDWIDAALGNPLADVARSSVILLGVRGSERASWFQKVMVGWYHRVYLQRTFGLRSGGEEEYRAWLPIVAAARMSEGISDLEDWLREQVETGLSGARARSGG